MHVHDLQGLHWSLPTSYPSPFCVIATLAYHLFLKYASSVLILGICNYLFPVSSLFWTQILHGSFPSCMSQFKYFLLRRFLTNQARVAIPYVLTITMLFYFFHNSYILFTYLFTEDDYLRMRTQKMSPATLEFRTLSLPMRMQTPPSHNPDDPACHHLSRT